VYWQGCEYHYLIKLKSVMSESSFPKRPYSAHALTATDSGSVESESTEQNMFSNKTKRLYTWKSYDSQVETQCIDMNQKSLPY